MSGATTGGGPTEPPGGRVTRGGMVRIAAGAAAALTGGIAIAAGDGASHAAPSKQQDVRLLNFFLLLERLQERLYAEATERDVLDGDLLSFATVAGRQDRAHARLLTDRLGGEADSEPESDFSDALASPERFGRAAIDLEEAAIAAYVAQGAALRRGTVAAIVPLVSVEARHAAWIRDLAGVDPAPRAADPPRDSKDILDGLREKGLLL